MNWSKDFPTEPGYYWAYGRIQVRGWPKAPIALHMIEVVDGEACFNGDPIPVEGFWWLPVIRPAQFPEMENEINENNLEV